MEKIVITGDIYDQAIDHHALILDVSPDNKVHYDSGFIENCRKDSELLLYNYEGRILIPRHTVLSIPFIDRLVTGKVASPIRIGGGIGDVILEIDPDSNLELCIKTPGNCFINGELQSKRKNYIPEEGKYTWGRKLEFFMHRYAMHVSRGNTELYEIMEANIASDNIEHNIFDVNVCTRYNLVYINKEDGMIKVRYKEPAQLSGQFNILYSILGSMRASQFKINDAVIAQDYRLAQKLQEESGHIRLNAERLKKLMQEQQKQQKI